VFVAEFYDLDGQEISYETWTKIFSGDQRFLAGTRIAEKGVRVSTVWIGLAWMLEGDTGDRPLIYETMVFEDDEGSWDDLAVYRWANREEALEGHAEVVDSIRSGKLVFSLEQDE